MKHPRGWLPGWPPACPLLTGPLRRLLDSPVEPETFLIAPGFVALILLIAAACTIATTFYLALTRPGLAAPQTRSAGSTPQAPISASGQSSVTRTTLSIGGISAFARWSVAAGAFASIVFITHRILRAIRPST
jgi:hypothetical protein